MNSDPNQQRPDDAVHNDAEGQETLPQNDPLTATSDGLLDHHHAAAGAICAGTVAQAMREFATTHSLPYVDACEVMRESGLTPDELFLDALHPTAEANRRYAEALSSALVQAGWPEARLLP